MPILFILMFVLLLRSLTLPGSSKGLIFLLKPDFTKLTGKVILMAMGQAFFTLSLAAGTMITYGSYIKKSEKLASTVVQICIVNCSISLLAGFVIFPAAFAFGINPGEGPGLAFITLPNIFEKMHMGYYFSIIFFLLLAIAALTSAISMLEPLVAVLKERVGMTRKKATGISIAVVGLLSIPCSLSFGIMSDVKVLGNTFFDICNSLTANYGMPLGSMIFAIFVGWALGRKNVRDELSNRGLLPVKYFPYYMFAVRYIVPVGVIIIFLTGAGII